MTTRLVRRTAGLLGAMVAAAALVGVPVASANATSGGGCTGLQNVGDGNPSATFQACIRIDKKRMINAGGEVNRTSNCDHVLAGMVYDPHDGLGYRPAQRPSRMDCSPKDFVVPSIPMKNFRSGTDIMLIIQAFNSAGVSTPTVYSPVQTV